MPIRAYAYSRRILRDLVCSVARNEVSTLTPRLDLSPRTRVYVRESRQVGHLLEFPPVGSGTNLPIPIKRYLDLSRLMWCHGASAICLDLPSGKSLKRFGRSSLTVATALCLDESTTTTILPPLVPRSRRLLRRNSTTLVKHTLSSQHHDQLSPSTTRTRRFRENHSATFGPPLDSTLAASAGKKPPGMHIIVPLDRHLATNNQKHNLRATI